jgi:hypothetical protein
MWPVDIERRSYSRGVVRLRSFAGGGYLRRGNLGFAVGFSAAGAARK